MTQLVIGHPNYHVPFIILVPERSLDPIRHQGRDVTASFAPPSYTPDFPTRTILGYMDNIRVVPCAIILLVLGSLAESADHFDSSHNKVVVFNKTTH